MLAADLVNEARLLLQAGSRPELNRLSGAVDASTTTMTVEFATAGITRGSILAVDLELVYVWAVSSQNLTVRRGHLGSTAAAHADDALVEVNPHTSDFAVFRAINQEIASFSSPVHGLYRIGTVNLPYSPVRSGYDLTGITDIIDVLAVEAKGYLAGDRARINRWRLIRDQDTADFGSGTALYLYEGAVPGRDIEVTYKAPFATMTTLADDVEGVTGMTASMLDIPPLGAAARLVATREVRRASTDAQPEPRSAADVPPGTSRQAAAGLLALRNQRLREEATRLQATYPTLSRAAS